VAKAIVAYHQKFVDEQTKRQIKEQLLQYDRTLLVADPRRCEPKKWVTVWVTVLTVWDSKCPARAASNRVWE
jgi:hypothetical protein